MPTDKRIEYINRLKEPLAAILREPDYDIPAVVTALGEIFGDTMRIVFRDREGRRAIMDRLTNIVMEPD